MKQMQPGDDLMGEDAPDGGEQQQTVELPLSAFGGTPPQANATFSGKVVSVDAQNGVVNATIMPMEAPEKSATDSMADEIDQKSKM
jgi:hypothetical protein